MKIIHSTLRTACFISVLVALPFLLSCGSGGGAGTSFTGGGIGGTGVVAKGTITGFGSVYVNGIEYVITPKSIINIDGKDGTQSDLRIGMVVTVRGTINGTTGQADSVTYGNSIQGPVDAGSIDVATKSFKVLGQTVLVDTSTVFDGTTFSGITDGNILEISGSMDADGFIHATWIQFLSASFTTGTILEVKGKIDGLPTATTFTIGSLTVDFGSVSPTPTGLGLGVYVEVKSTTNVSAGVLTASSVEVVDTALGGQVGDDVELEGFVTYVDPIDPGGSFKVNDQSVITNTRTMYENGTAGDVAMNVRMEVEGSLDVNGVLVAEKVSFRLASSVEIEGDAQAVDASNGIVTILGIPVMVNSLTEMKDSRSGSAGQMFNLGNIARGDHLVIGGYRDSGGNVVATRLERDDASTDVEVQGPVDSISDPLVAILGVAVDTTGFQDSQFLGIDDAQMGRTAFFISVQPGSLVKAQGTRQMGGTVLWDEVNIEG